MIILIFLGAFARTLVMLRLAMRMSVEPKKGGGSKPTVYVFLKFPSFFIDKLQTTVPNKNTYLEIEHNCKP